MVGPSTDVVGVGNAIVDVIAEVGHAFIDDHELVKNSMTLIDLDRANELEVAMPSGITASGGSAANTMVGVAGFGGVAAYLGLVAADDLGEAFRSDLRAAGVLFEGGAAVNVANNLGATPVWLAASTGSDEMVARLLEAGAEPRPPTSTARATCGTGNPPRPGFATPWTWPPGRAGRWR